jgi:hypothetical protein
MSSPVNRRAAFLARLPLPVAVHSNQVSASNGMLLDVEYDAVHGAQYLVQTTYEMGRGINVPERSWMRTNEVTIIRNPNDGSRGNVERVS